MPQSRQILAFLKNLSIPVALPRGVVVLNPYLEPHAWTCCEAFYEKYYADSAPRTLVLGINPGRLGGGLTGIPFTDPIRLTDICGISNPFPKKGELSSEFMYRMIAAFGGAERFYRQFYFSSVSPLGFTQNGKNLNYYDSPFLEKRLTPLIHHWLQRQIDLGCRTDRAFCVGEAENFRFLTRLNEGKRYFKQIIALPHPRFIMQYRRKKVDHYVALYLEKFGQKDSL